MRCDNDLHLLAKVGYGSRASILIHDYSCGFRAGYVSIISKMEMRSSKIMVAIASPFATAFVTEHAQPSRRRL